MTFRSCAAHTRQDGWIISPSATRWLRTQSACARCRARASSCTSSWRRVTPSSSTVTCYTRAIRTGAAGADGPSFVHIIRLPIMAYNRCQNYILLLTILLCDINITFCNMHGLFGYLMSHYAIFILYYAT